RDIRRGQDQLLDRIRAIDPDVQVLAQVQRVLNAVLVQVDASSLDEIASLAAVERVAPVGNYELDLSETVPYIGATAVQENGIDGSGVAVAVLDSGIDYTHANLGGAGTLDAYEAAYGTENSDPANTTRDGLFPTAKVVDGYDFVGEEWPTGPLAPDPDPIDFEGHGTHVADIIGGQNGVAPGVDLYAVKVCSAISPSCSGVALLQGMEFSVDPNGDGVVKDRVDIINMSLGSLYGQPFDDDLSTAVDAATALGVLTVASAGNSADKPFVTGSPAAAETALSVAQTQVPSAQLPFISVEGIEVSADFPAVFQPWSAPPTAVITGEAVYGNGDGGNLDGCAEFTEDLTDRIVLIDRGGCFFTTKIFNVQNAGGLVGIIGLVAPGAPFPGGFADPGGPITIPGYMISQGDNLTLQNAIATGTTSITIDPDNGLQLAGSMVGSSSRGPQFDDQRIKPEIGAPGASISAEAGTGTGETPFGGTSGAAPMVAGSAALVIEATGNSNNSTGNGRPNGKARGFSLAPTEIKALLMNSGETEIYSEALSETGELDILAEVSRIGGGEVRVNTALGASALAYDADEPTGALSFGYVDVTDTVTLTKTVTVKNLTGK
ncbi:MAG: S8 family serine peptidase, partial [Halobacteriales archaeon]|nr:S8 family serine peptidase [Halobacteriales archaeon]